ALRRDRGLDLHHQTQWALPDMEIVGMEALIRWTTWDGVEVPPSEFIPTVEQTSMIGALTRWVLARAARDMSCAPGSPPRVAVNVSARSLAEPRFVEQVTESFAWSGEIDLTRLELEITETALMAAPDRARRNLAALRDLGLTVALDDFGTGYSSLGMLRTLPVDTIKIDQSFVIGVEHDPTARRLVGGIVDLAHALDLTVVAEGIENEMALEIVCECGCDVGQGFHLGRPGPVAAAAEPIPAAGSR
ncbi:MAG: EAL domain-containing protein, partial [Acidimicrobiales bacterium]